MSSGRKRSMSRDRQVAKIRLETITMIILYYHSDKVCLKTINMIEGDADLELLFVENVYNWCLILLSISILG